MAFFKFRKPMTHQGHTTSETISILRVFISTIIYLDKCYSNVCKNPLKSVMKTICVYAGSSLGNKESFSTAATNLGHALVNSGFSMVYGGGSRGLMGVVADAVLSKEGHVTGIITKQLDNIEVGHKDLTVLEVVDTMHERKARMAELSG